MANSVRLIDDRGYNVGGDFWIQHAISNIKAAYGDTVSIYDKNKDLLKFGVHTSVGTGWETMMELQDSETAETFVSGNTITSVISSSTSDDTSDKIKYEFHTVDANGDLTFGVSSDVTLNGQTKVTLPTACCRVSRAYNSGTGALVGNVAFYEGGTATAGKVDNDATVHMLITAGEQQSQKAQTSVSSTDYWIIQTISVSVLSKTSAYAEARLEIKPFSQSYWRPLSQNFATSDSAGTVELHPLPYLIVPSNHDVRLAVKANTAGVNMAGGFNGVLAKVI